MGRRIQAVLNRPTRKQLLLTSLAQDKCPALTPKALELVASLAQRADEMEAEVVYAGLNQLGRNLLTAADA